MPEPSTSQEFDNLPMRTAWGHIGIDEIDQSFLKYIKQIGVDDVLLRYYNLDNIKAPSRSFEWNNKNEFPVVSYQELIQLRNKINDGGLRLCGFDALPNEMFDRIIFGKDGREKQISALKETIRNMGRAKIPLLGYHWYSGARRTSISYRIRGGAQATGYDHEEGKRFPLTQDREYTEDEMWENYEYFVNELVPVAEEAGVKLALHPNDPPLGDIDKGLGGVPYIFRDIDGFKRALELYDSPSHGLKFCFGCFSEMANTDVYEAIKYFSDRIHHVHFRDVTGNVPNFNEVFIDEGDHNMFKAIKLFHEVGFKGPITPDHVPNVKGDTNQQHRGYAFTLGYIQGLLNAVYDNNS